MRFNIFPDRHLVSMSTYPTIAKIRRMTDARPQVIKWVRFATAQVKKRAGGSLLKPKVLRGCTLSAAPESDRKVSEPIQEVVEYRESDVIL